MIFQLVICLCWIPQWQQADQNDIQVTVNVALMACVEALEAEKKVLKKSWSLKLESKVSRVMIPSSVFILALRAMRFYYTSLSLVIGCNTGDSTNQPLDAREKPNFPL